MAKIEKVEIRTKKKWKKDIFFYIFKKLLYLQLYKHLFSIFQIYQEDLKLLSHIPYFQQQCKFVLVEVNHLEYLQHI